MIEELKTTLDNGVTLWVNPQFKLGVKPSKLKAGDILAYHRTACHSEGFRVLILNRTKTVCKTVILFNPVREDFKVGTTYAFRFENMMVTRWRIV